MPSSRERTVVMTEIGTYLFYYLPILLRNRRYRVTHLVVSPASARRLEAYRRTPWPRWILGMLRDVVRYRSPWCLLVHWFLSTRGRDVIVYDAATFTPIDADYLCSLGFLRRIPATQIACSRSSSNVHWSLLPDYAGCHPHYWPFRHGARESGVTIHRIHEAYDDGDILMQERIAIAPSDTSDDFRRTAKVVSQRLFRRYLRDKTRYDAAAQPQDASRRRFFAAPDRDEHRLRAGETAEEIRARFRASGPSASWVETGDGPRPVVAVDGVTEDISDDARAHPFRVGDVTVYTGVAA
ncbi:MAG: formyltransferase family protein [Planctomycetota bacterium]|jgi:hypothetical protein